MKKFLAIVCAIPAIILAAGLLYWIYWMILEVINGGKGALGSALMLVFGFLGVAVIGFAKAIDLWSAKP